MLRDQPVRFNELRRMIEGICRRCCRRPEEPGTRRPGQPQGDPDGAGHRRYSITSLATLSATVDGLRVWAETHIDKVLKAQKQYDAAAQRTAA